MKQRTSIVLVSSGMLLPILATTLALAGAPPVDSPAVAAPKAVGQRQRPPLPVPPRTAAKSALEKYPTDSFTATSGETVLLAKARGRVATVLVSLSVECPISTEYLPTLNGLAARYRDQGVNFVAFDPQDGESLEDMAGYAREHKLAFTFVHDKSGQVARQLRFKVTPEVCVFDAAGQPIYRGRIDDRYRARGAGEPASQDLVKALDELLAGKPVTLDSTKAVGCPIQWPAGSGAQ